MNDFPSLPLDNIKDKEDFLAIDDGTSSIPKEARKIPYPVFTKEDLFQIAKAIKAEQRSTSEVEKLTEEYRTYVGANYALATSSGTSAIHLALIGAGIEPGDEVIIPSLTFIATAMAVLHAKAIPIFADIESNTFCLDPKSVERNITSKTKAIMPVHIHGLPANMPALRHISKQYKLKLLEDASHAHSAKINNAICGALGDTAGQSLMADKNFMVGGEGGIAFFSDVSMYERIRTYVNENGIDYRMSWVVAAIGRSQLRRLKYYDSVRARNAQLLSTRLNEIGGFIPPYVPEGYTHSYNMFRITIDPQGLGIEDIPIGKIKEAIKAALLKEGVPAREWQNAPIPLHAPFINRIGWGYGYPWSQSQRKDWKYGLEHFPNTIKVLDSSLVLCREIRCPIEYERVERYAYAFKKIKKNKDAIVKLAKNIDYIPCYFKDPRLG